MKNIFKSTLLIAFIGILSFNVFAGDKGKPEMAATVNMEGTIIDADTHETLAGVSVKVVGTDYEVKTDLDGNFNIEGLIPGEYKLEVSYISYKETKVVQPVSADSQKRIQLSLKSE